jgi:parallel beta-helix repeat protein
VPADYPTIQAALDAASPGDRITIAPGTYVENLTIGKRDLALAGADPATVIVQAKFPDLPVVTIRERNVTLLGLTLTGGQRGVKIESRADNGVLANLVIQGNEDEGLLVDGGRDGEVRRCTIIGNGKGVYVGNRGSLRLQGNRISGNGAGIEAVDANRLELRENLVTGNRGCGLNTDPATQLVGLNNVITGNGTDLCGAAQGRTDLLDRTPPPAPRNLTVKPEGWTNLGRFTLDWTDPEDLAGISAYWFKVGAPPATPTDGTRREIGEKPLVLENPPEGEQPVFVWLEDGMGNKDHRNTAQVVIRFDKTPPTGRLSINDGAQRTTELRVILRLQAQDNASGLAEMRFSNDGRTWTGWEAFSETKPDWDLSQFGGNANPGLKAVYAELRDRAGNVARLEARIEYIVAKPPTASFTVTPADPRPGQPVTFDASASSSPNGKITKYAWDLGDGTKREMDRPTLQHTYAASGRYTVCLVVTDELGLTATASRELVVEQKPATLRVPQDFFTVEEALRAAQAGDIILLSPGVYSVNLVLEKSVTLKGAATPVTLQGKDGAKPVLTVQGLGVEVRLENLAVLAQAGATAPAVSLSGEAKLILSAMSVSNQGSGAALLLRGTSQATVAGTEATPLELKSEGGTAVDAGDEAQLELTDARATGKAGIALSGEARATLTRVTVTAAKAALCVSGSAKVTLDTPALSGEEAGIVLSETAELTVRKGTITTGKTGIGVDVSGGAKAALDGVTLSGGLLNLRTVSDGGVRVLGSTLKDAEAGVLAGGPAVLLLQGNTLTDHPQWGILLPGCRTVSSSRELRTLSGHTSYVNSVAFSPDGKILASGSYKEIKLWDVATGKELRTLRGHTDRAFSVAFSPDGKILASGSEDKTIKLWDVATGTEIRTLQGHTYWVYSVAFSPDGKILASGSYDETIKLWDVATGRELRTLSGHTSSVESVAFSPDGKILASGSYDETIKLWDVATGKEIRTLSGHTGHVLSVAFSPDGKVLASGSDDKTIKLWLLSPLDEVVHHVSPFTGTIVGGENLMARNGTALPADLMVAGQGDVCSADLLFLVKK